MVAQVDDEDYEYLSQFRWYPLNLKQTTYAKRKIYHDGIQETIMMHREIMKTPKGMEVDHRDRNGLNNQKSNLRNCTRSQNMMNRETPEVSSSKYRGVMWVLKRKKWKVKACIKTNGVSKHIGYFDVDEEAAARAYDREAMIRHGEFAQLNFPEEHIKNND